MSENSKPTFVVTWSDEDEAYVAVCPSFPSLSWVDRSPVLALSKLREVIGQEGLRVLVKPPKYDDIRVYSDPPPGFAPRRTWGDGRP